MPLGPLTITAAPGPVADAVTTRLGLTPTTDPDADVCVTAGPPAGTVHYVILTGPLTDDIDTWDQDVAPQTVAGGLWVGGGQQDADEAAVAWLVLRSATPTTPLSDLTDNHDRALRWSVVSATTVVFPPAPVIEVDPDDVKAWTDDQPEVQELGDAVARVGGETADAVLASVQRLRTALLALQPLGASAEPSDALDTAVAEHLRQVQRTGFGKWRGAKARAASLAGLQSAARDVAGARLREVLTAREAAVRAEAAATLDAEGVAGIRADVAAAVAGLELPVTPDFDKVPRPWTSGVPTPRRYVFVNEDDLEAFEDFPVPVRPADLAAGQALCAIVQSGFSLPALR